MKKRYAKPMTATEIAAISDQRIDFSDTPALDETFWNKAELVVPDRTSVVTLRVKRSVLEAVKAQGRDYQTRMNQVLESHIRAQAKAPAGRRSGRQ